MKKRVVLTGLGALTAAGEGAEALWQTAVQKKSKLAPVTFGDDAWKPIGGQVPGFEPEKFVTQRKSLKVMARDIQLAVAAASLAFENAGLKNSIFSKERFGVTVGSGVLNHEPDELAYCVKNSLGDDGALDLKKFGGDGLSSLFPLWLLKYLPNMSACHISILFDLRGPNNSITTGASAGLQAVGEAARIVARGDADLMLAGGAESKLNPVGLAEYKILGLLSDTNKPGLVIGEGAGFLIVEELEHAKKRGAKILAEVAGIGSSAQAEVALAKKSALKEAGIAQNDIDYLQDAADLKNLIGFTGFASGALDLIVAAKALQAQVPKKISYAMTTASGLNGQSISMILKGTGDL